MRAEQMRHSALLTDFYQFTMAYSYWQCGMHNQEAVFHLFFRRNPKHGDCVIASGLETTVAFLNQFHFSDDDIVYLASLKNPVFSADFLAYLKTLRFTGDIDAMPEGSVVFSNEPLLRIKAPLLLCQLLETPLINAINFSSAVTSIAARMRTAAGNDTLFEFGLRRAQGPNGGLTASRAAFLAGFDATSNVLAAQYFDIPVVGTMAHSWVMAFDDELFAFEEYARLNPDNVILLVDTYDTKTGVDHAITVGKKLKAQGRSLKGIRLDSGDLATLSGMVREKLNQAGFSDTRIMVSGDLTEERIMQLKSAGAPIDGWGIGTHLSTAFLQPALDMVYKLGAIQKNAQWHYKLKRSDNRVKTSDPGILQVKRFYDEKHEKKWLRDLIYHVDFGVSSTAINTTEKSHDLLLPVFRNGVLVNAQPTLREARTYCLEQVKQFNASKGEGYLVERESRLMALKQELMGE
ncbi:MAG: nicotinate phosphoribosyltransferase [Gammaproteobacteria bacterium RIFCSPHIGHO2_12_FULL_40_19]|nr:MAG: nicotinate phosphoribosyltransferase [Gammaproteobacteria bacterium RIFCSPHIGHO2_12_FULL_40_19]